jgi:hypothetical protein
MSCFRRGVLTSPAHLGPLSLELYVAHGAWGGGIHRVPRSMNWGLQRGGIWPRKLAVCPACIPSPRSPAAPQIRTLRLKILAEAAAEGVPVRGARNQLRMYLTMAVAAAQPLLMYWLTFHLVR